MSLACKSILSTRLAPQEVRTPQNRGNSSSTTYAYDPLGRTDHITNAAGKTIGYGYDGASRLTSVQYPTLPDGTGGGTITRTYSTDNQLASVTDFNQHTTTFAYNPDGALSSSTFPASTAQADSYKYDNAGQLAGIDITKAAEHQLTVDYQRTAIGQISQQTTTGTQAGLAAGTINYTYDQLGQLTTAGAQSFAYTPAGGLTDADDLLNTHYDGAGQLTDGLLGGAPKTVDHDALGQTTTITRQGGSERTYAYDQAQQLKSVGDAATAGSLAVGSSTLALDKDGALYGWGSQSSSVVGVTSTTPAATPVAFPSAPRLTAVQIGSEHQLGLGVDGTVYSWGKNSYGQLGPNGGSGRATPASVQGLSGIAQVSTSYLHSLAVDARGTVYAWGSNSTGELGNGTTNTSNSTPQAVTGLPPIRRAWAGSGTSYALDRTGHVWAWGYNAFGSLGDGTRTNRTRPVQLTGLPPIIAVAPIGSSAAAALDKNGNVWWWGSGFSTNSPIQTSTITNVKSLLGGPTNLAALTTTGDVYMWGNNRTGQLGDGSAQSTNTTSRRAFAKIPSLASVRAIAFGGSSGFAVRDDGTVVAWGDNFYGGLGDGTTQTAFTPVATQTLNLKVPAANTTYTYDGDGLRTTSTTPTKTSRYIWDPVSSNLPMLLQDQETQYIYGPDGAPIEQIKGDGTTTYLHHDHLGSTRLISNPDGSTAGTASFTPYGQPAATTGTNSRLGYAGQYTDPTGLQYNRARYYDPATGQFISRDPLEASTGDPYTYAAGDPVDLTDPSGLASVGPLGGPSVTIMADPIPPPSPTIMADPIPPPPPTSTQHPVPDPLPPSTQHPIPDLPPMTGGGYTLPCSSPTTLFNSSSEGSEDSGATGEEGATTEDRFDPSRPGHVADAHDLTVQEVKDRIHDAKRNLIGGGGANRNPDVHVDPDTGEIYPINDDRTLGDSIGNILDD